MAEKTPLKAILTGTVPTAIGEFVSGDTIPPATIGASAITATKIAANAVTAAKVKASAITYSKIAASLALTGYPLIYDPSATSKLRYVPPHARHGGNYLINGDFGIWQRGSGFATPTDQAYFMDQWWYRQVGTACGVSIGRVAAPLDLVPQVPYDLRVAITIAPAGGICYVYIIQRIEDVRTLAGEKVTLAVDLQCDEADQDFDFYGWQNFGSGGSDEVHWLDSVDAEISTTRTRYSCVADCPSVSGKTIGAGSYSAMGVRLVVQNGDTPDFTVGRFMVNPGSTAQRFIPRPYEVELALCQRYYQKSFAVETTPANGGSPPVYTAAAYGTGSARVWVPFPVRMRAAPTPTLYGPSTAAWQNYVAGAWTDATTSFLTTAFEHGMNIETARAGAFTQDHSYLTRGWYVASAEL